MNSIDASYYANLSQLFPQTATNTTKRSILPISLNASTATSALSKKVFIPFVQERDHLGRLLRDEPEDSQLTKVKSLPLKLNLMTPMEMKRRHEIHKDKLPSISRRQNDKSLFKMMENSFDTSGDETKVTTRNEIDGPNFLEHLYLIKSDENRVLEVEPPSRRHIKTLSSVSKLPFRDNVNSSSHLSLPTEIRDAMNKGTDRFSALNMISVHNRNISVVDSAYTGKSAETLPHKNLTYEDDGYILKDSSSLYNPTVWRYGQTSFDKNIELSTVLNKNSDHKKKNAHRLLQPLSMSQKAPPIGLYNPQSQSVKHRSKNAMIFPEHDTRIQNEKLRQIRIRELHEQKRRLEEEKRKKALEDDMKDDQYYRILFKEMLSEINHRASKNHNAHGSRRNSKTKGKKLDYIVLGDYPKFPPDFENKINEMKNQMRVVKDKICAAQDANNPHEKF